MAKLPLLTNENLLCGLEAGADAAIYKLNEEQAVVQTLDFFTPVVDDPFEFGQIAAANSLSDVYAVGATPVTAMNIVCFPMKTQPIQVLEKILAGGLKKIKEAGALLVGGHSVEDPEPKYGLSVLGMVHPKKFITNAGAKPGDCLILTKPIGTGIMTTAHKAGLLNDEQLNKIVKIMKTLNKDASEAMTKLGASGATDITGFGLVGHALEMARASKVRIEIITHKVPMLKEALRLANMGFIPEGSYANRDYCSKALSISSEIPDDEKMLLFDAQTSGGLLISIGEDKALSLVETIKKAGHEHVSIIGKVSSGRPHVEITP